MWIWKSAQSAFSSWTMILGMLIGGVTVFNFLQRAFKIGLNVFFEGVLNAYRAVFHTLFNWLTFWMPWDFPLWVKDATIVWFVLWGAMARIIWIIYAAELRDTPHDGSLTNVVPVIGPMFRNPAGAALGFVLSLFIWPLLLVLIDAHFYKWTAGGIYNLQSANGATDAMRASWREAGINADDAIGDYLFDIRMLYVVQLAMMLVVAVVAVVTNETLSPA